MSKIVNDFAPSYLSAIFEMSQSPYDMHDKSRLVQPKVNSTSMEWNRLSTMAFTSNAYWIGYAWIQGTSHNMAGA